MMQVALSSEFIDALAEDLHKSNPSIETPLFKAFILSCKVWPYEWGAIMAHGNDMHLHVFISHRKKVYLKAPIKKAILETFNDYDQLTTSVLKIRKISLVKSYLKMGWKLKSHDQRCWYLVMKKEDFTYV